MINRYGRNLAIAKIFLYMMCCFLRCGVCVCVCVFLGGVGSGVAIEFAISERLGTLGVFGGYYVIFFLLFFRFIS
ncbi:hypothetical protein DFH27DRAFT_535779 [Peziza echinospora]|nr:hypothetical protein DFH27DRAFT_535779 [Peziza echinospora]